MVENQAFVVAWNHLFHENYDGKNAFSKLNCDFVTCILLYDDLTNIQTKLVE